jgi:hypothetical protein
MRVNMNLPLQYITNCRKWYLKLVHATVAELSTKHWFCGGTQTKNGSRQIFLNQKICADLLIVQIEWHIGQIMGRQVKVNGGSANMIQI